MNALERLLRCALRHRLLVVTVLLAVTLVAVRESISLKVDNGLDAWFLQDDPALLEYRNYQQTFGNDELLVVAVERAHGFRDEIGLRTLDEYSSAIAGVSGIAAVQSAGTASDPGQTRHLLSGDGKVALIIARLGQSQAMDSRRAAILDQVDRALAAFGITTHKAGVGVIYEALNETSIDNAFVLLVVSALLVTLALWMFTGQVRVVAASMCSVLIAAAWTMGLYAVTDHRLSMVTMILPSLVLVVGIATCVHIFVHCAGAAGKYSTTSDGFARLFFIIRPCLASALASAAGFAALETSRIPVIRELGLFSAAGALLAVGVSILICALAMQQGVRRPAPPPAKRLADRLVAALVGLAVAAPRRVVAGFLALFVVAVAGMARIEVDTFTLDYLFPDHAVRRDSDYIESRVGPYTGLDFVIHSNSESVLRTDVVAALASWQKAAIESGAAGWSVPAATATARGRVTFNSESVEPAADTGPKPSSFPEVMTDDARSLRVTFGVRMQSARALQRTIAVLLRLAVFPTDIQVDAAGYLPLYTRIVSHVVDSQLASMGISFILAFLVMGVLLRSAELTFLAFFVNVLPPALMLGFMGFAGIPIDVATVTTSAIILGLMVDEAIHILYRLEKVGAAGHLVAIRRVMEATGQPLAVTTALLIIGFGVLTLAEVRCIVWFGLLVPIGAVAAFSADVMLLPALVVLRRPALRVSATLPQTTVPEPATGSS